MKFSQRIQPNQEVNSEIEGKKVRWTKLSPLVGKFFKKARAKPGQQALGNKKRVTRARNTRRMIFL